MLILLVTACSHSPLAESNKDNNKDTAISAGLINPYQQIGDIPLPAGYNRIKKEAHSFAGWLSAVQLKKNTTVYRYDGIPKTNQAAQFAVLDISVGNRDLQQCADAVMRLRAEYLFSEKKYADILFVDNEGNRYQFKPPFTRANFDNYLQRVFGMCGSASLAKQLRSSVRMGDIQPGDVLIRGGFPGHAVLVMDVAENASGKKIYMIAQSYMPAQDIHLLKNPADEDLSPWYEVDDYDKIITPEYVFYRNELKRW